MNKTANESLKMIEAVKLKVPLLTVPLLCIHGTSDNISLVDGSEFIVKHAGSTQKSLQTFPGLLHELTHERQPDRDRVIAAVVAFVEGLQGQ